MATPLCCSPRFRQGWMRLVEVRGVSKLGRTRRSVVVWRPPFAVRLAFDKGWMGRVTMIQRAFLAPFVVQKRVKNVSRKRSSTAKITQIRTKKVKNEDKKTELDHKITQIRTKVVKKQGKKKRSLTAKITQIRTKKVKKSRQKNGA